MADRISREEFIEKRGSSPDIGPRRLRDGFVVLACDCDYRYCEGWTMIRITDLGIGPYGGTQETIADALAHRADRLETHPAPTPEEMTHAD